MKQRNRHKWQPGCKHCYTMRLIMSNRGLHNFPLATPERFLGPSAQTLIENMYKESKHAVPMAVVPGVSKTRV